MGRQLRASTLASVPLTDPLLRCSVLATFLEPWQAVDWAEMSALAGRPVGLESLVNPDAVGLLRELREASAGWAEGWRIDNALNTCMTIDWRSSSCP